MLCVIRSNVPIGRLLVQRAFIGSLVMLLSSQTVAEESLVGKQVITNSGAEFKEGDTVVYRTELLEVHTVDAEEGDRLWVKRVGGWVERKDVGNLSLAFMAVAGAVEQERSPQNLVARGLVWVAVREFENAAGDFTEAIELNSKNAPVYFLRGFALQNLGEYRRALADYDRMCELMPEETAGYESRAWIYATCPDANLRDAAKAVADATKACEVTLWKDARCLTTLAAAYAEAGDFAKAIEWQEKALAIAWPAEKNEFAERLDLCRAGQPFREAPIQSPYDELPADAVPMDGDNGPAAADQHVLTCDVPDGATILVDGRVRGAERQLTWSGLAPGRQTAALIQVRFPHGGEAQRVVMIAGGQTTRLAVRAPSRIVYEGKVGPKISGLYSIRSDGKGTQRLSNGLQTDPAISPDGAYVAYCRSNSSLYEYPNIGLWIAGINGSNPRRLKSDRDGVIDAPSWSPDGKQLVFTCGENNELWIVGMDGTGLRRVRLPPGATYAQSPSWSPDGKLVAFSAYVGDDANIYTIRPDGKDVRLLVERASSPSWSPDGGRILFVGNGIHSIRRDGSDRRRLASGGAPAWSPDASKIAFCTDDGRLAIMDPRGRVLVTVSQYRGPAFEGFEKIRHQYRVSHPRWSPDGKQVLYAQWALEQRDGPFLRAAAKLFVINADGKGPRPLAEISGEYFGYVLDKGPFDWR